jgi:hypothetical protein
LKRKESDGEGKEAAKRMKSGEDDEQNRDERSSFG